MALTGSYGCAADSVLSAGIRSRRTPTAGGRHDTAPALPRRRPRSAASSTRPATLARHARRRGPQRRRGRAARSPRGAPCDAARAACCCPPTARRPRARRRRRAPCGSSTRSAGRPTSSRATTCTSRPARRRSTSSTSETRRHPAADHRRLRPLREARGRPRRTSRRSPRRSSRRTCRSGVADSWRLFLSLLLGEKPVVTGAFSAAGFAVMRDLQLAVRGTAGGAARAARCAVFSCCPTAPLKWSYETSQNVIDCARARRAGRVHLDAALRLRGPGDAGRAASCSTRPRRSRASCSRSSRAPGAPVVWGGSPAVFDVRYETTPMGAIETMMLDCANAEVGKQPRPADPGLHRALRRETASTRRPGSRRAWARCSPRLSGINSVSGPGHARLRELPEPREAGPRRRDLRHGGAPAARDRAARRLPVAAALRGAAARGPPADRRPHAQAPQGADPLLLAGHRARAARPLARGGRDDARRSGRRREVERLLAAWTPSRLPDETKRALRERMGARGGAPRAWLRCRRWRHEGDRPLHEERGAAGARARSSAPRACPTRTLSPRACGGSSTRRSPSYAALVEPRAVLRGRLTAEAFAAVLAPARPAPADDLVGRAASTRGREALALFVATLGEALPARIRHALRRGRARRGLHARRGRLGGRRPPLRPAGRALRGGACRREGIDDARVLPYSPGYCGWPTTRPEAALRGAAARARSG